MTDPEEDGAPISSAVKRQVSCLFRPQFYTVTMYSTIGLGDPGDLSYFKLEVMI